MFLVTRKLKVAVSTHHIPVSEISKIFLNKNKGTSESSQSIID